MRKVCIADHTGSIDIADSYARLGDELETTELAINYYELEPGDQFGFAFHRHRDQEEVFVVQEGAVTFETMDGSVTVESGEVIRFEPGEFQIGSNRGNERVTALALGAPRDTGEIDYYVECPECGEETVHRLLPIEDGWPFPVECTECGSERTLDSP